MATTFPASPGLEALLLDAAVVLLGTVGTGVFDVDVVTSVVLAAVDRLVVGSAVELCVAGVVGTEEVVWVGTVVVTCAVVVVTGVRDRRVPAIDEGDDADGTADDTEDETGARPGTVTGGRACVTGAGAAALLRAVVDPAGVEFWPTALPHAASNNTAMPWPAAIRAVRRFKWEDTPSP